MKSPYTKILVVAILMLGLVFTKTDSILESFSIDQANNSSIRFWILISAVTLYGVFASRISIQKNQERNEIQ